MSEEVEQAVAWPRKERREWVIDDPERYASRPEILADNKATLAAIDTLLALPDALRLAEKRGAALADVLEMTGCRDAADLQDMANVGKALIERVADVVEHGPLKGWMPADCPTEIVTDLANALDEARQSEAELEQAAKDLDLRIEELGERAARLDVAREALERIAAATIGNPHATADDFRSWTADVAMDALITLKAADQ